MFQGTESERDSRSSEPHSFVNHYANVNSTFRQSWKKQKAVAVPTPRAATGGASVSQVTPESNFTKGQKSPMWSTVGFHPIKGLH